MKISHGPSTRLIHAGSDKTWSVASLTTPIYETTTFVFESAEEVRQYQEGKSSKYLYSRYANPTVLAAEETLASLDGAERALVFSSGMGAVSTTLLALLKAGDEIVCSAAVYGGTYHFIKDVLPGFQVNVRLVSLDDLAAPEKVIGDRTRVLWFESPINPTLRCVDVRAVASACRAHGVSSVVDNTFASPINQRPLDFGVDIVMQSATKYLNGHSDVTAGVIAGSRAHLAPVDMMRRLLGTVLDPQPAYALGRGLKTLAVRMERHNSNGMAVARFLEHHPRIVRVFYPGLESHPEAAIARAQMTGFGGMVTCEVEGGLEAAERVFDRLKVIRRATSLGGVESLISLPVLTSHWGYSPAMLEAAGVTAGMLRLSIGLEDADDLTADLGQALE